MKDACCGPQGLAWSLLVLLQSRGSPNITANECDDPSWVGFDNSFPGFLLLRWCPNVLHIHQNILIPGVVKHDIRQNFHLKGRQLRRQFLCCQLCLLNRSWGFPGFLRSHIKVYPISMLNPLFNSTFILNFKKKHLVSSLKSFNPYISSPQIPNFCSKNSTCPAFGCISQQRHVWREGRRPKGLRDLADHRGQPRVEVAGGAHPHGEGDRAGRHWRMQKSESKARALLSKPHSKVRQKFSKYQSMHFVWLALNFLQHFTIIWT